MSQTPPRLILLPSSPTPSTPEFEYESDQSDNEVSEPKRILGVRELRELERIKKRKPEVHREITILGHPDSKTLATYVETSVECDLFARDVCIKGWKIVGGKGWGDKAKIGAYVDITLKTGGKINILKRYTDFVNLRQDLKRVFPHLKDTIPRLPGKAHMSKFSDKFLQERQPRLQRFLRTIILHPEMGAVGGGHSVIGDWVTKRDG